MLKKWVLKLKENELIRIMRGAENDWAINIRSM